MTDLDIGRRSLTSHTTDNGAIYLGDTTEHLSRAAVISATALSSSGKKQRITSSDNVHTVETEEATIKFVGGVSGDLSASDSEEEQADLSDILGGLKSTDGRLEIKAPPVNTNPSKHVINGDSSEVYSDSSLLNEKAERSKNELSGSSINHVDGESNSLRQVTPTFKQQQNGSSPIKDSNVETTGRSGSTNYGDKLSRTREPRFNPFDRDVVFEENYFATPGQVSPFGACENHIPALTAANISARSRTKYEPHSFSSASDSFSICSPDLLDDEFSFADLGLAEDHFSRPEGHFGMSTLEELEMAMENCKAMIKEAPQHSDKQKTLVRKLVQLRMKYQEYKEGPDPVEPDVKMVVGHKFKQRDSRSSKHYCEKCNTVIWGMLQTWYRCTACGYNCHEKCLNQITRTCASVKVSENPSYILSICPEKGLAYQHYRCSECRAQISFKSGFSEPRLCDYSGNFYCELCHWNDVMIIPARVLHNWDFVPRKVCRAAKQYLRLMTNKAVLRIQDINPMLFSFVEELDDVRKLREEILIMKKYFLSCKAALESKLLLQLSARQHCVENSDMYSLKDLVDCHSDLLLPELAKVHSTFAQHIKSDCQLCQAKGFICELCDTHEVLFPFDNIAVVCAQCSYVLHRHCFVKKDNTCPRCERWSKRNEISLEPS